MIDAKENPNPERFLKIVRGMTEEQRLKKEFELSDVTRELSKQGLRERFPDLNDTEFKNLYFERLELCHTRNW